MSVRRPAAAAPEGLTVADVMHAEFTAFAPAATVGDVRDWFAGGASRRLALVADGGRYVGCLSPSDVAGPMAGDRSVAEVAWYGRTVAPGTTAAIGRDEVLRSAGRRVPVVDGDGRLRGVLALTSDVRYFACRDADSPQQDA
jgi:CBS domain-containing protein